MTDAELAAEMMRIALIILTRIDSSSWLLLLFIALNTGWIGYRIAWLFPRAQDYGVRCGLIATMLYVVLHFGPNAEVYSVPLPELSLRTLLVGYTAIGVSWFTFSLMELVSLLYGNKVKCRIVMEVGRCRENGRRTVAFYLSDKGEWT